MPSPQNPTQEKAVEILRDRNRRPKNNHSVKQIEWAGQGQAKGSTMAINELKVDPRDAGRMSKCNKL